MHLNTPAIPAVIPNIIAGKETLTTQGATFDKISPHTGKILYPVARSQAADVTQAITAATHAQPGWAEIPAVQRGTLLHTLCNHLEQHADAIAHLVALETGKSFKDAKGETAGAIALGRFYAGEGQRLYAHTTTSAAPDKYVVTTRQPCGIAGLIVAANTPIANVAWKVFPALICGNAAILKAPEDAPATAWFFVTLLHDAGLPAGVLNLIQGLGEEAGSPLVSSPDIDVVSFTGSTKVGRWIAETAGKRLAKISLELGGKNPFVVCEDADIAEAVKWACLSAFSNAGQRCAAGSRIIIVEAIYDQFVAQLVDAARKLTLGGADSDDLGPVINKRQMDSILAAVADAKTRGATLLCGGNRLEDEAHAGGYYIAPTLLAQVAHDDPISTTELFGPVAVLYKAKDFSHALMLANDSPYGLTACIHTRSIDRAQHFVSKVRTGMAVINAGTFGSEPHMPFGGLKQSGNGSREPGTEALDIYSELKSIYYTVNRGHL